MPVVSIADFGTGNLHSVINAIEVTAPRNFTVTVTREASAIRDADRLVLPGQGAIGTWMDELKNDEIKSAVEYALGNKPVLGICLGLQALYAHSEEDGGVQGLGVLEGKIRKFDTHFKDCGQRIKIPHMGWNIVHQKQKHPLWKGIPQDSRFYFVHSFYADAANLSQVAATASYGTEYACAAAKENLFAVQFHPEKSRNHGLALLGNFLNWNGTW